MLRSSLCTAFSLTLALAAQDPPRAVPPAAPGGAAVARTAQEEVEALLQAAHRGDAVAFWDWLPANYQTDIEGLLHAAADRVDAKTYDRAWRLVQHVARLGLDKQQFVFGNAMVADLLAQDAAQQQAARTAYASVCKLLQTLAGSELGSIDGLRTFAGRTFADTSGKPMLAALFELGRAQGDDPLHDLARTRVTTLQQDGDEARLELRAPGRKPDVQTFVRSGGRWLPTAMVRDWAANMQHLRAKLAAMPTAGDPQLAAQARLVLGTIESYVRKFEDVESQAEFDEVVAEVLALTGRGAAR